MLAATATNALLQGMERSVDLCTFSRALSRVLIGVLPALGTSAVHQNQRAAAAAAGTRAPRAGRGHLQNADAVGPRRLLISSMAGGGATPKALSPGLLELLRGAHEHLIGTNDVCPPILVVQELELHVLLRQQIHALLARDLEDPQLHGIASAGGARGRAVASSCEDVSRCVLHDRAHGVGLPAAGLPEHEERAELPVEGVVDERQAVLRVDVDILRIRSEGVREAEAQMMHERAHQISMEEAVVNHDLAPLLVDGDCLELALLLFTLEHGSHADSYLASQGLLGADAGSEALLLPLRDGRLEEIPMQTAQCALVVHRARLQVAGSAPGRRR
mmetsp:Transcript_64371/g.112341  ORF Transcript_64371/g.112341 Transcript_64371/m.112341 type:complete len:332 (-) Transcript_64371:1009-2004(-)